jgi:integrase
MVLSQEELARLIDAAASRLYRMIVVLLYATGLRRTEASLIKVEDIDSKRMVIHIRQGKGDVLTFAGGGLDLCVLSEATDESDFVEHGSWLRFFWFVRCLRYTLAERV